MRSQYASRGAFSFAAILLIGSVMTGCDGGSDPIPASRQDSTTTPVPTATGMLTVVVTDQDGRPLADATVFAIRGADIVDSANTGANGVASFAALPAWIRVVATHEFAGSYRSEHVSVAQQGVTFLALTLEPDRPRPTVALLPVSIPIGSVSEDRSELTLKVEVVASAAAPFVVAQFGDNSEISTPALALTLGEWDETEQPQQCSVWLDKTRTALSCGISPDEDPYKVSVLEFTYDPIGRVPMLATQRPADSVMLLMDKSGRVSDLDPSASRSFAAKRFIARAVTSAQPRNLSIAALAGDGGDPPAFASLPEQPLWVPLGAATVFSTDRLALESAIDMLEPLVGGAAPVFEALDVGLALTSSQAPPGNGAIVALLGGGDETGLVEPESRAALASLRHQRDDAGVQAVLIAAASPSERDERLALAELAAALHAPTVSLGVGQSWSGGSYAALDLAADLIDGAPLPSLSAVFRVKANQPEAFPAGETLYGLVALDSASCPWHCLVFSVEFAAEIP